MDLEIEREFQRWAEAEEASYLDELNAKARAILDTEDIQLPTGELIDSGGRLSPITRERQRVVGRDGRRRKSRRHDYELHVERLSHSPRFKKISTMAGTAAAMIHVKIWKSSISGYLVKEEQRCQTKKFLVCPTINDHTHGLTQNIN